MYLNPSGDHFRTRLTHTLEVAQIARTIARSLRLNEDLTEAAALGHDLGHAPFGHAGEEALNSAVPCGFKHDEQSLRIVETLEKDGRGLNLTYETRRGIQEHSKGGGAIFDGGADNTLEGAAVRVADAIAYLNHDIEDAVRAGALRMEELPKEPMAALGSNRSMRIGRMVGAVIEWSEGKDAVGMRPDILEATEALKRFMYAHVYPPSGGGGGEIAKAKAVVAALAEHYMRFPEEMPALYRRAAEAEGRGRAAADYVSGMTDRFALETHDALFRPRVWSSI